jgi:hypothetical protein
MTHVPFELVFYILFCLSDAQLGHSDLQTNQNDTNLNHTITHSKYVLLKSR